MAAQKAHAIGMYDAHEDRAARPECMDCLPPVLQVIAMREIVATKAYWKEQEEEKRPHIPSQIKVDHHISSKGGKQKGIFVWAYEIYDMLV